MCRSHWLGALLLVFAATACVGEISGTKPEGSSTQPPETEPPDTEPDAGPHAAQPDAPPVALPDAPPGASDDGIAPVGALDGEEPIADGPSVVHFGSAARVFRIDAEAGEHVEVGLTFTSGTGVTLGATRWDGTQPVPLATTNEGVGVRFLAVLDPSACRTYWMTLKAAADTSGTLTVTRSAFPDGIHCSADCARLFQLPLANDPAVDGYDSDGGTVFRYQFGRRDLVMLVRYLARTRARAGKKPVYPYDFSQWDGQTPGTDVGAPRHLSHQRGKDVDVSLYGLDGLAVWRSYCTTHDVSGGHECIAGTRKNFDGYEVAREIGSAYQSGRVTMCFLDRELIAAVAPGAQQASADGFVARALVPLFADGKHLQHWPNHDNHVHIRVSETEYNAKVDLEEPFEAP
jgi:hypothetical protein